jgi:hypothetical protein
MFGLSRHHLDAKFGFPPALGIQGNSRWQMHVEKVRKIRKLRWLTIPCEAEREGFYL